VRPEQLRNDLTQWRRIRAGSLPAETVAVAAAARAAGDWRTAAAVAHGDVDIDLDAVRERFGDAATDALEDDLRHLALDLLWWHLPRHRAGMTTLRARTAAILAPETGAERAPLIRVGLPLAPTGPQRLSLTVVDLSDIADERWYFAPRHTWDVRAAAGLRAAWGGSGDRPPLLTPDGKPLPVRALGEGNDEAADTERIYRRLAGGNYAGAWFDCGILLEFDDMEALQRKAMPPTCPVGVAEDATAAGRAFDQMTVSTEFGAHMALTLSDPIVAAASSSLDFLDVPYRIATSAVPADLVLIFAGLQTPDDLHPLMRSSLFPERRASAATTAISREAEAATPVRVRCAGAWHRVEVAGGELRLADHSAGRAQHGETGWLLDRLALGTVDPHMRDANGWTLMHMAMWMDHDRLAPVLRDHGVAIDARDRIGRTPLYVAVHQGGPAAWVRWLLDAGADPYAETVHGADAFVVLRRSRRSDLPFLDELRGWRRGVQAR
jgi:hypothetical protein